MNTKLLVGVGAAVVVIGAAAYVGGIAYTKSVGNVYADEQLAMANDNLAKAAVPVKIEEVKKEDKGFSSDAVSFKVNIENVSPFSVFIDNTYGFGSVNSKLALGDDFYTAFQFDDKSKAIIKKLVDGYSASYNIFSDKAKGKINFDAGSFEKADLVVSWKAGSIEGVANSVSKTLSQGEGKVFLPEIVVTQKGQQIFNLTGLNLDSEIDGDDSELELALASVVVNKNAKFDLENMKFDYKSNKSKNGAANNYDLFSKVTFDKYSMNIDDKPLTVASTNVSLDVTGLDFSKIISKCGEGNQNVNYSSCLKQFSKSEQEELYLSLFNGKPVVDLNVKTTINGAKVDLKNNLKLKDAIDPKNPMKLMNDLEVVSDYTIDASLFADPMLQLGGIGEQIKSFAKDPAGKTLEYHIEFKDAKLTVNGKQLM